MPNKINSSESENRWMGSHYAALFLAGLATFEAVALGVATATDKVALQLQPEMLLTIAGLAIADFSFAIWAVPAILDLAGKWNSDN